MEVGDGIFLGVYFYYTILSYRIEYRLNSIEGLFSEFR